MKSHTFKVFLLTCCYLLLNTVSAGENEQPLNDDKQSVIAKQDWIHGSPDCKNNKEPANEIYKHNDTTFIIRQNKCLTYEAPFIYVLVGEQKILVLDTGAIKTNADYSLRKEIEGILGKEQFSSKEILVIHSHGHRDHYRGDSSFKGLPNVNLVKPSAKSVRKFFGFRDWPQGQATIELGKREITVIPTPGHQEEAITLYDHQTKWLLTGDTLYPGNIYIKDWKSYRISIDKLTTFANNNDVAAIMGAHIEMTSTPGSYYPIGSTYQPDEAALSLSTKNLYLLNTKLKETSKPKNLIFDEFVISPMSKFQKTLSNTLKWFTS